jgi:hypothetical protein
MKNKIVRYSLLAMILSLSGCVPEVSRNPEKDQPSNIKFVEIYNTSSFLDSHLIFIDKTTGYRYIRFYNGGVCRLDDKREEDK